MRGLVFWVLLFPGFGFAQENSLPQKRVRPPYTLKIVPLALINPYQQSVVIRADIPISPRWGIDVGVGWVLNSLSLATFKGESYQGLRVQPAIKYYGKQSAGQDNYVSLVFKYNDIHQDSYVQISRQGGQYAEWILQRKHRIVRGVGLRFGRQQYVGARKRWVVEPFAGLGFRQLRITEGALPPDAELLPEEGNIFSLDRQPGIYTTSELLLGFYVGWRIGGRNIP